MKVGTAEVQVKLLAAGDSFTMAVTEVGGKFHWGQALPKPGGNTQKSKED